MKTEQPRSRIIIVLIILLTVWLYWRAPLVVPPGLEMDELIEAQIAEQVERGDLQPFYEAGQGREALYHYWLAAWMRILGHHVFTLRIASTTLSLLGLAAVFQLTGRLFSWQIAALTLVIAATTFWTLFSARSGLRSTALPLFAALSASLFWHGLDLSGYSQARDKARISAGGLSLVLAGLVLGLSVYTYTAARILPAVFLGFILYLLLFHRSLLSGRGRWLIMWAVASLLLVFPLWRYLQVHPELDQFAFMDFNRPLAALESGDPEPALRTTLATLGMFNFRGDPLIFDNVPGRPVFDALMGLFFLAGLGIAIWRWRKPAYFLVLIWLVVSLVPGMLSQPAPNFYRTVSAQVVAFIFPAIAVEALARSAHARRSSLSQAWLVAGIGGLLVLTQLANTWPDYFNKWPEVEGIPFFWQQGLAESAEFLGGGAAVADVALCTVLTYELDAWWRPAWQSMPYLGPGNHQGIRYYDCRVSFVLPDAATSQYIFTEPPVSEIFLPAGWEGYWLNQAVVLANAIPADLGVVFQLAAPELTSSLPSKSSSVWLAPEAGGETVSLPVRFGEALLLQDYYYETDALDSGERLHLVTEWQVLATPPPGLALFSHLLSDPQTVVAQQDGLPLTSHSLQTGDRFWVLHDQIQIPAEETDSPYLLSIGLYDQKTMIRLSVYDGELVRGDRLFLQPVQVNH